MDDIWNGIFWFFTSPETNSIAMGIAAMMTLVMASTIVPSYAADIKPVTAANPVIALLRKVLVLAVVAALTAASAGLVWALRQP